jgi:hypothetical protein
MKTHRLVVFSILMLVALSSGTTTFADDTPFWRRVLRFIGVSSNPGKSKGAGDKVISGKIWIADLAANTRVALTSEGGFRSPIFLPANDAVLALKDNKIVKISLADGAIQTLYERDDIIKLLGLELVDTTPDPNHVLILSDTDRDGCPSVGVFDLRDGSLEKLEYSTPEDKTMVSHLQDWNRVYDGGATEFDVRLEIKTGNRRVEWTDVYLKRNDSWTNISKCEPVNCSHPSISHDRKKVAFIKSN